MIVRSWHGWTDIANTRPYEEHLRQSVLPELKGIPGFLGWQICRREIAEGYEFRVDTHWESLEAIRAFAGPELEKAVVPEEAQAVLLRFEDRVTHYEVRSENPS